MRDKFNLQLQSLNDELVIMGTMIENAIELAVKAITERNTDFALEVSNNELLINEKEKEIEALCFKILLKQQPVASDLRLVSSALKMITDMERIGDQAEDIAEISITLSNVDYCDRMEHFLKMAKKTKEMVNKSVEAYVMGDVQTARAVIAGDDVIDHLFDEVKNDLIEILRNDVNSGEQAIDLLMVAKYFERIGDHATNIAEWAIYSVTGEKKI